MAMVMSAYCVGSMYFCILDYDMYKIHDPCVLGKKLIAGVPTDPHAFHAWRAGRIKDHQPRGKDYYDGDSVSSTQPVCSQTVEWVYIIDLDVNTFSVACNSGQSLDFRLDNLPRFLFDYAVGGDFFIFPVPLEHLHFKEALIRPDHDSLQIFKSSSQSHLYIPPRAMIYNYNFDPWRALGLTVLERFVERFGRVFSDLQNLTTRTLFVSKGLGGHSNFCGYQFKQISYALLTLCSATTTLRFKPTHRRVTTPSSPPSTPPGGLLDWEAPEKAEYWFDDCVVVLEPNMAVQEHLHAALGKAIQLARASHLKSRDKVAAIIFSIESIVLVNITINGGHTDVSYTPNLRFIALVDTERGQRSLTTNPTEGLAALLDFFALHSPRRSQGPASLPAELCTQIFHYCTPSTQRSMAVSCRLFLNIARQFPKIGDCELFNPWLHYGRGNEFVGFVARRGAGVAKCAVGVMYDHGPNNGEFTLGVFRGAQMLGFNMTQWLVVKEADEGFVGCACCVGLPVLKNPKVAVGVYIPAPGDVVPIWTYC